MPTGASLLTGPRAALHFRLSTQDSRSAESKQRHALQRLSEREGGTFAGAFVDHERGRNSFSRSDFDEMIEEAEHGTFDVMVLAILARFTRRWYGGLWRTILWDILLCRILLEDNDNPPTLPASGLDTCGEAHRMIVPQPMAQVVFQA